MSEQIPTLRVLSQCISPASKTVGHHRHREPELLLVTSGELRALLNGLELVLREGEGLFINSGAAHGVVANSKEGANFICVSFSTDCIAGADDTRLQARYVDPILKARNLDYVPCAAAAGQTTYAILCAVCSQRILRKCRATS